jgi:hypothetical protein
MATEQVEYVEDIASLSMSVYIEMMTILGAYRDALVLVGGWAPYFILERFGQEGSDFQHVGSGDVDIAIDHRQVSPDQYSSIVDRLERHGYRQRLDRLGDPIPFIFERTVKSRTGRERAIHVDFLAGEYEGTGKSHRHQRVQRDLLARKARGCDVVFDHCFDHELRGTLPDGAENVVQVKIADMVACLTTKGITLDERDHEKDAYDIYSVIAHCAGGPAGAARAVRPHLRKTLVREGVGTIAGKFETIRSIGPQRVARFLASDSTEMERITADAFVSVREFIQAVEQ